MTTSRKRPLTTELKQRRRRRQRERQKSNRFTLDKTTTSHVHHAFFNFPCRHCTTTTWNCLVSRFVEDVNTRRLSFSFSKLWYGLLEFNFRKIRQHLTNWTRWDTRDKVWSSATSLLREVFEAVIVVVAYAPYSFHFGGRSLEVRPYFPLLHTLNLQIFQY